jgi:putative acyl-CoA dehydrogenase
VGARPLYREARGADARLDTYVNELRIQMERTEDLEVRARRLVERLALALQASLLVRHAPPDVADAFCASHLAGDGGLALGTLPPGTDFGAILERSFTSA